MGIEMGRDRCRHPRGAGVAVIDVVKRRTLWLFAIASIATIVALSAHAADQLKFPVGYRSWFHVNTQIVTKDSPLFDVIGGMHNVHVNSVGEATLKKGGPYPYPDGTVFIVDLHDFSVVDGSYVEGPIKGVALMQKDSARYAATGGLGL
jgi:Cytochrome P460